MNEMLTPKEVANKLKVKIRTIHKWLRAGKLKGAKIGNRWRIKQEDLKLFIENNINNKDIK